jgi:signal transduction histidine kinase/CheY-like chemotaxis protein
MTTILIVDDHPTNREVLAALLAFRGYGLLEAANGAEALVTVRARRPDLVIADILMPTMDGYEFVRRLRADPAIASTPVIFYTAAYNEREALSLARACGVEHLLIKPAEPRVILETVASALGQADAGAHAATVPTTVEAFDREHVRLLTDKLVQQVAALEQEVAERARAEERQGQYAQRLTTLHAIDQAILAAQSPEEIAEATLRHIRELVPCQRASIDIFDLDAGGPRDTAADGAMPAAFPRGAPLYLADLRAAADLSPAQAQLLAAGLCSSVEVPIRSAGGVLGSLNVAAEQANAFNDDHFAVFGEITAQLAVALQNARLFEQVRQGRQRLQVLSSQLVRAQEDERRRLARELHDEIGQSLTAAQLNLQALCGLRDVAQLPGRLEDSLGLLEHVLQQVRAMSLDLRPSLLDDLGLTPALRWLVKRQSERAGFAAHFRADGVDARFSTELETTCFRVAQEALNNITRHARATMVTVELAHQDGALHLHVADDGIGFDVEAARQQAARGQSLGLLSMRERVELAGGAIDICSAPGDGATIDIHLPLSPADVGRLLDRRRGPR